MEVGIENIMTDILDLGGLQVGRYISKNYTSQVNQALSKCFFSVFSENLGRERGINYFSNFHHACMYQQLLGFMSFSLNLKNEIAKTS